MDKTIVFKPASDSAAATKTGAGDLATQRREVKARQMQQKRDADNAASTHLPDQHEQSVDYDIFGNDDDLFEQPGYTGKAYDDNRHLAREFLDKRAARQASTAAVPQDNHAQQQEGPTNYDGVDTTLFHDASVRTQQI